MKTRVAAASGQTVVGQHVGIDRCEKQNQGIGKIFFLHGFARRGRAQSIKGRDGLRNLVLPCDDNNANHMRGSADHTTPRQSSKDSTPHCRPASMNHSPPYSPMGIRDLPKGGALEQATSTAGRDVVGGTACRAAGEVRLRWRS